MSIYSDISKRIGWEQKAVAIPTENFANQLLEGVKACDETAFEQVFKIYRFAPSAKDNLEEKAMLIICDAYKEGCEVFK